MNGLILDAREIAQLEPDGARQPRQLGRPQQPSIFVRAARNQAEQVFAATIASRKERRLRLMVEMNSSPPGRSSRAIAPSSAAGLGTCSISSMQVMRSNGAGGLLRELLGRALLIVDLQLALVRMQPRDLDHGGRQVDAGDVRAVARERLGQQPAAAADIEHARCASGARCAT